MSDRDNTDRDRMIKLLDHKRAEVTWVVRPVIRYYIEHATETGKPWVRDWHKFETRAEAKRHGAKLGCYRTVAVPEIEKLTRIVQVWTKGTYYSVRVGVTDWTGREGKGPVHSFGAASGCGYDKLTAALTGCTVAGVELGDHSDHEGRANLSDLLNSGDLEAIGASIGG